jgi:hypothetical protein
MLLQLPPIYATRPPKFYLPRQPQGGESISHIPFCTLSRLISILISSHLVSSALPKRLLNPRHLMLLAPLLPAPCSIASLASRRASTPSRRAIEIVRLLECASVLSNPHLHPTIILGPVRGDGALPSLAAQRCEVAPSSFTKCQPCLWNPHPPL